MAAWIRRVTGTPVPLTMLGSARPARGGLVLQGDGSHPRLEVEFALVTEFGGTLW